MTVSKSGVSTSVGGKGLRVTKTASGRVTRTIGLPGTGLWHTSNVAGSRSGGSSQRATTAPIATAAKPGLFAPAGDKALYKEVLSGSRRPDVLRQIAKAHPPFQDIAMALAGWFACGDRDYTTAEQCLRAVFISGLEPEHHPFATKYLQGSYLQLEIAPGVKAVMPLGREAIGLSLAEIAQDTGRLDLAIETVEQLEPTYTAAISLAELYSEAGRHEDVISLTNNIRNDDDQSAFLVMLRGVALRENRMPDAAREAFREALRRRSADAAIRHRALLERAVLNADQGKKALARKDLEKIIAEDSHYPGVTSLLHQLSDNEN